MGINGNGHLGPSWWDAQEALIDLERRHRVHTMVALLLLEGRRKGVGAAFSVQLRVYTSDITAAEGWCMGRTVYFGSGRDCASAPAALLVAAIDLDNRLEEWARLKAEQATF